MALHAALCPAVQSDRWQAGPQYRRVLHRPHRLGAGAEHTEHGPRDGGEPTTDGASAGTGRDMGSVTVEALDATCEGVTATTASSSRALDAAPPPPPPPPAASSSSAARDNPISMHTALCPACQSSRWYRRLQKHRDLHREHTIVEGAPHETHGPSGAGGGGSPRDARQVSIAGRRECELLAWDEQHTRQEPTALY